MFEVIVQSDPNDHQSLEILKEAYSKLGMVEQVVGTSKKMAKAYETSGQLSSAILEYESILELRPDDAEVKGALSALVSRADSYAGGRPALQETDFALKAVAEPAKPGATVGRRPATEVDDGREMMRKVFVDGKHLSSNDFDQYWVTPDLTAHPTQVVEPFIQVLADKSILPLEQSLRLLCDRSRLCYLPLEKYDVDADAARQANRDACLRWCVLPFDRMSKSLLVATANPFNHQAATELKGAGQHRLLWYLASPPDIVKIIRKVFR
jgi:hypothetical protein